MNLNQIRDKQSIDTKFLKNDEIDVHTDNMNIQTDEQINTYIERQKNP